jgi:hypothetical protein
MIAEKSPLIVYDTRDDRREIADLLRRLPPLGRVRFVQWLCDRAYLRRNRPAGPHLRPRVSAETRRLALAAHRGDTAADERVAVEAYCDVFRVCSNWEREVSFADALAELVRRVRAAR